jgi:hypothetical protein
MPARRLVLLLATLALLAAAPQAAQAAKSSCPAKKGTLAHDRLGRVWHSGHSLYACTTVYDRAPRARRLGPWASGTKVAWDGSSAAWSVPLIRDGVRSDRAWVASAEDGKRWLLGTRLIPATGSTPAAEGRVQRLFVFGESAGWVTRDGSVVLAVHSPQDVPAPFGTLPTAPAADHKLVLVGRWPSASAGALAASVQLGAFDGDGDECGGSESYRLTVVPDATGGTGPSLRLGVSWLGGWERPFCG